MIFLVDFEKMRMVRAMTSAASEVVSKALVVAEVFEFEFDQFHGWRIALGLWNWNRELFVVKEVARLDFHPLSVKIFGLIF